MSTGSSPNQLGDRPSEVPVARREGWAFYLTVAAVCAGLAALSIEFSAAGGRVSSIGPMNAMVFALLIKRDSHCWFRLLSAAAFGNFAGNLLMGDSWPTAATLCGANVVEALTAAFAFRRLAGREADITQTRPLLLFLGLAITVPALSALIAAIGLTVIEGTSFYAVAWHRYAAHVLGMLVFAAALLAVDWRAMGNLAQAKSRETSRLAFPALCPL